jgi:hypothetical protein
MDHTGDTARLHAQLAGRWGNYGDHCQMYSSSHYLVFTSVSSSGTTHLSPFLCDPDLNTTVYYFLQIPVSHLLCAGGRDSVRHDQSRVRQGRAEEEAEEPGQVRQRGEGVGLHPPRIRQEAGRP